jgi:hypothetical protein
MTLDENDFLTFQLYTASKTPRNKNSRIRSWVLTVVTFACMAFLFYYSDNEYLGYYFLALSGLSLILFPFYSRWRYKQFYLRYIRDNFKNRFGEHTELEFNDDSFVARDKTGEVKINKSEIEEINEIKDYYFMKTRTGLTLIISKTKADDIERVRREVRSLVEIHGIPHNIELNWKWK